MSLTQIAPIDDERLGVDARTLALLAGAGEALDRQLRITLEGEGRPDLCAAASRLADHLACIAADADAGSPPWWMAVERAGEEHALEAAGTGVPVPGFLLLLARCRDVLRALVLGDGAGEVVDAVIDRLLLGAGRELAWAGGARMPVGGRMGALGRLAGVLAHEINNPISFILPNLEYVIEELSALRARAADLPLDDLLEAARQTLEGAKRVRGVIHALRSFAPPEGLLLRPVDLREVVAHAAAEVGPALRARASLLFELAAVPSVRADVALLTKVAVQLLAHAAETLRDDPARERIRVRTTFSDGQSRLEIEDSGTGVPADLREHIFDPRYTTRAIGCGTGLGLCVCHNVVTALGGGIDIVSGPGQGTKVIVSLPAIGPAAPPRRRVLIVVGDSPARCAWWRALADHDVWISDDATVAASAVDAPGFDLLLGEAELTSAVARLRGARSSPPVHVLGDDSEPPAAGEIDAWLAAVSAPIRAAR